MDRRDFLSKSLLLTGAALVGCQHVQIGDSDDVVVRLTVNTLGVGIGVMAARMPDEFNVVLRNVYSMARDGKLDPESLNKLIGTLSLDPVGKLMIGRVVKLADLMGASVIGEQVHSIAGLDPALLNELGSGYLEGYNLEKSSGNRRMV